MRQLTMMLEGDSELAMVDKFLRGNLPRDARVIPVNYGGNRALRDSLRVDIPAALEDPDSRVLVLMDLFNHPFRDGGPVDKDSAVGSYNAGMEQELAALEPGMRERVEHDYMLWETEALLLAQPELFTKGYGFPEDCPLFETPENVNGELGVNRRIQRFARETKGCRNLPGHRMLCDRLFPKLAMGRVLEKCPHFAQVWQKIQGLVAA